MKISQPEHKTILLNSFYVKLDGQYRDGKPVYNPVVFPVEKLAAAGSAKKKLVDSFKDGKLNDEELEFTPSEVSILKDGFDRMLAEGFSADESEKALSLKSVFDGIKE